MTNEEAIKILKFERGYFCDFKGCQEQQAYAMAIKALERETILYKIKAEIIELRSKQNVGVLECLDIIDKYITELNPSYNSVKTELEPCEDWKFYYKHGYAQARKDVLDKIRTEITDWQTDIHDNENDAEIHDFIFERIYEILDEYKAESDGDENGVCSL